MKKISLFLLLLYYCSTYAQGSWKKIELNSLASKIELYERKTQPDKFNLFSLNLNLFKIELQQSSRGGRKTISLPGNNGEISTYSIQETSNFTQDLDPKYGFIKSYSIQKKNDPTSTGKLSIGVDGVHITIYSSSKSTLYIDPYAKDNRTYIVYNKNDIKNKRPKFNCSVESDNTLEKQTKKLINKRNADDGVLRVYRLALTGTGEYSQFHINRLGLTASSEDDQRAAVLSVMNTSITRLNGVYEKDIAVRMNIVLIGGVNPLIFLDPDTDPFATGGSTGGLDENQTAADNLIGDANYDIGHLFLIDDLSGVAIVESVCSTGVKARGQSGLLSPFQDPFDIDFVCHEIGHQFGAFHTQNNSCQRNAGTAVEPGSASTIMGYAGICDPNVQGNSDDHFHAVSIDQMWTFIQSTTCASEINTGNTAPVANAGSDVSVPKSTPLILKGAATDINGISSLTYCWEQIDNEIATMPPVSTSTAGPTFRSISPTDSPDRYLPTLPTVVSGSLGTTWEVLPTVAREMNFALVVRDNHIGGGASSRDDMKITVTDANPFLVTAPNTAVTWNTGSTQTITWDKSTTDQAPIDCQNVRIKLSIDGGETFPIILSNTTPNDGSHTISVPNNPTTNARIMVEAIDNIFYNVNTTNFTINSTVPTFVLNNTTTKQTVCNTSNPSIEYNLNLDFVNGFNETVSFSVSNEPTGANITFSPNSISNNGVVKMTVTNLNGVVPDDYNININASSTSVNQTIIAELQVLDNSFTNFALTSPSNGATNIALLPSLTWGLIAEASSYDIQIASDNAFSNIVISDNITTNSYTVESTLRGITEYFWRVRAKNSCGTGNYTSASRFTTIAPSYCSSTFTDEAGGSEHITNVTFNTINNTSGNDTDDGYIDYTAISTTVKPGDSHQVSVTFDTGGFQDHCYVFIDWNQDFTFENNTERYDLGTGFDDLSTRTFNITIPSTAQNGSTRMRVVIEYNDTADGFGQGACDSSHLTEWGETEDYTLIINTSSSNDSNFSNFNLFPNPSSGKFNLSFEVLNTDNVDLKLFDLSGRLIENLKFKNTSSIFSKELDFENYNSGMYLLRISNGGKEIIKKIIIK